MTSPKKSSSAQHKRSNSTPELGLARKRAELPQGSKEAKPTQFASDRSSAESLEGAQKRKASVAKLSPGPQRLKRKIPAFAISQRFSLGDRIKNLKQLNQLASRVSVFKQGAAEGDIVVTLSDYYLGRIQNASLSSSNSPLTTQLPLADASDYLQLSVKPSQIPKDCGRPEAERSGVSRRYLVIRIQGAFIYFRRCAQHDDNKVIITLDDRSRITKAPISISPRDWNHVESMIFPTSSILAKMLHHHDLKFYPTLGFFLLREGSSALTNFPKITQFPSS